MTAAKKSRKGEGSSQSLAIAKACEPYNATKEGEKPSGEELSKTWKDAKMNVNLCPLTAATNPIGNGVCEHEILFPHMPRSDYKNCSSGDCKPTKWTWGRARDWAAAWSLLGTPRSMQQAASGT